VRSRTPSRTRFASNSLVWAKERPTTAPDQKEESADDRKRSDS
jgi:hypothetical protein